MICNSCSAKMLSISIHPDLRVIVKAPENTRLEDVEKKVFHHAKWILNQQRRFVRGCSLAELNLL